MSSPSNTTSSPSNTTSSPSNTTSSPSNTTSSPSNTTSSPSSSGTSESAGLGLGVSVGIVLVIVGIIYFVRRRRKKRMAALEGGHVEHQLQYTSATRSGDYNLEGTAHMGPRSFSYEQLQIVTKNFSEVLGRGGFGSVYRGTLAEDGTLVAVKSIAENSNQGSKEYEAEVTIISDLRHRNLVRLRGWCHDQGKFMLVYEYMPNGSLDQILFDDELCSKLSWERRYAIAAGLGSAVQYLHEECDNVIIHRDIKSSNVLLDESFNAKLGDFGLSRQVGQGITSLTTTVAGTRGYMAPECLLGPRKATRETDVYAFGAVLVELVCGKRASDIHVSLPVEQEELVEGMLVDWVWHLHSRDKVMEAVDIRLKGMYDNEAARRMLLVGLLCSNPDPKARPKIRRALDLLLGSIPLPSVPSFKPTLIFGPPPPMTINQILGDSTTTNSTSSSSNFPNTNSTSSSSNFP